MFSQTIGTALGDWTAETMGLGYDDGAIVFSCLLGAMTAAYFWTHISRTKLFWAAFTLTLPLGVSGRGFSRQAIELQKSLFRVSSSYRDNYFFIQVFPQCGGKNYGHSD
jgi:uncharacterized membrane-anchored protein